MLRTNPQWVGLWALVACACAGRTLAFDGDGSIDTEGSTGGEDGGTQGPAGRDDLGPDDTDDGPGPDDEPRCEPVDDPFADGPGACDLYFEEPAPPADAPSVPVEVINLRDRPIALFDSACHGALFRISGQAEGGTLLYPAPCQDTQWCSELDPDGPGSTCDLDCPIPLPVFLPPGGSVVLSWNAWVLLEVALPPECDPTGTSPPVCGVPTHAVPGRYRFKAQAATAWACEPGAQCSCTLARGQTWCHLDAPITPGNVLEAAVQTEEPCMPVRILFH